MSVLLSVLISKFSRVTFLFCSLVFVALLPAMSSAQEPSIPQIPNGKLVILAKSPKPNSPPLTPAETEQLQAKGKAAFVARQAQCAHPANGVVCHGPTMFEFNRQLYIVVMRSKEVRDNRKGGK